MKTNWWRYLVVGLMLTQPVLAQEAVVQESLSVAIDTLWVLIAAALIMFMQAGFALLESGLVASKHGVSVLMKNLADFSLAAFVFWALGFALMFGTGNDFLGWQGFFLQNAAGFSGVTGGLPLEVFFFFQLVFAGTAATIVSGAIAGRVRFFAYLVFTSVMIAFIYPLVGHWVWGGGWLARFGFVDFAGSTVVHVTGGFAALAAVFALGPRSGRFVGAKAVEQKSSSVMLAGLGVFILWLGWFGFNGGSVLSLTADPALVGRIFILTNLGAAAGALSAMAISWLRSGKPDVLLTLNGVIGGLVAVTAGAAYLSFWGAVVSGAVAGGLVIWGTWLLEVTGIDDAVGAVAAHGLCGIWGTVAVALFGLPAYGVAGLFATNFSAAALGLVSVQVLGTLIVAVLSFGASYLTFVLIGSFTPIRVSKEAEVLGADATSNSEASGAGAVPGLAGAGD